MCGNHTPRDMCIKLPQLVNKKVWSPHTFLPIPYDMGEKATKEIIERIEWIVRELGMSERQFILSMGLSLNWFSDLRGGRSKTISEMVILFLETKYGVNHLWLTDGTGSPWIDGSDHLRLTDEEIHLIELYRQCSEDAQRLLMASARGFALKPKE